MLLICLSLVGVSFLLALLLSWAAMRLGRRWGYVDRPGSEGGAELHKQHGRVVPVTGGVAIFLAVAMPLLAALVLIWLTPADGWRGWLSPVSDHVEGIREQAPTAVCVLAALAVLHVMGLIDDRRGLSPWPKLLVQLLLASALAVFADLRVLALLDQFGPVGTAASIITSVLWMVVITNALNFLDNMDGLAGGVAAAAAGLYLAATLMTGQWFVAATAALLVGALLAFLCYNLPPARLFMGDAGSLVVGMLLAVLSVQTTYFDPTQMTGGAWSGLGAGPGAWYGVLMPLMILAVPLYDFVSVTAIRLAQGKSPFRADRQHFSHRLVQRGLSPRGAVLVIWLCTLATGLSGVMLWALSPWQALLAAAQTLAVLAVLALIERLGSRV